MTFKHYGRVGAAVALAGVLAILGGCAEKEPTESSVSWLAPQTRAAKPLDCQMPMLNALPAADYQQIAIVEVSADYNAGDPELYDLARRKACETGADALVILEDQRQKHGAPDSPTDPRQQQHTPEVGEVGHKGRYLNSVAIIYTTSRAATDSSRSSP